MLIVMNNEMRKSTLTITRGIMGSGKSTAAMKMVAESDNMLVRINRDDLRAEIFGRPVLEGFEEKIIGDIQDAKVRAVLKDGRDVIVDDTNLPMGIVRHWHAIAVECGADFKIINFEVPLEVALERNLKRGEAGGRFVPEEVIKAKFERFTNKGKFGKVPDLDKLLAQALERKKNTVDLEKYVPDTSLPKAWIFDMDGTLALFDGIRGPYEFNKVSLDAPHEHVVRLARMVQDAGYQIIITSAREDFCMDDTKDWLDRHGINYSKVFMRKTGDKRADNIVKNELFNTHIRNEYHICGVVDDRLSVCRLWFDLGLPLFRVGDPEIVF